MHLVILVLPDAIMLNCTINVLTCIAFIVSVVISVQPADERCLDETRTEWCLASTCYRRALLSEANACSYLGSQYVQDLDQKSPSTCTIAFTRQFNHHLLEP